MMRHATPPVLTALVSFSITIFASESVTAHDTNLREQGFTADHIVRHRSSDAVLETSVVSVSEHGLKVRHADTGFDVVLNYTAGTFWLIDTVRGIRHSVPVTFSDPDADTDMPGAEASRHAALDAGILSTEACAGLTATNPFEARWRGRDVTISTCVDAQGDPQYRHWYSSDIGLVIRTMDTTGFVEELRNIRRSENTHALLDVSEDLRVVSVEEFFPSQVRLQRFEPEVVSASTSETH